MLQLPIFAKPRWLWNLASTFLDVAISAEDPCGRLSQRKAHLATCHNAYPQPEIWFAECSLSVCASGRESVGCPGESFCPWLEPLPRSAGGGLEWLEHVVVRCARIPLEIRSVGNVCLGVIIVETRCQATQSRSVGIEWASCSYDFFPARMQLHRVMQGTI